MRETSLACLLDLGLKSHSRATRSHSVPGDDSSMSFTKASSAALEATTKYVGLMQNHSHELPVGYLVTEVTVSSCLTSWHSGFPKRIAPGSGQTREQTRGQFS